MLNRLYTIQYRYYSMSTLRVVDSLVWLSGTNCTGLPLFVMSSNAPGLESLMVSGSSSRLSIWL